MSKARLSGRGERALAESRFPASYAKRRNWCFRHAGHATRRHCDRI